MSKVKGCLLGYPDDEGVRNVGGRLGASRGPAAFREFFYKLNGERNIAEEVVDLEDIPIRFEPLEEKHEIAIETLEQNHKLYDYSIVVGGGHDYSYCHLKGISKSYKAKVIGCINIDTHFDMRKPDPEITSGSPFYLALEEKIIKGKNMISFGIQPHSNNPDLWKYAKKQKVNIIRFQKLRFQSASDKFAKALDSLSDNCDKIVISIDMDSIGAPFAPGVSSPAIEGFSPSDMLEIVKIAAEHEKVVSLGIFELNPNLDVDGRTARLAAALGWYFAYYKGEKK